MTWKQVRILQMVQQPDIGPVVAALLAEADRQQDLAVTLADPHEQATALAQAIRKREQAAALALSPDDED
jgi:hypothetical protein